MPYFDQTTIITNNALKKMRDYGLKHEVVRDAFNHPTKEEWSKIPGCKSYIKTRKEDEVGVIAKQNEQGFWVIISVWWRKLF
jgi:hypothetical protein